MAWSMAVRSDMKYGVMKKQKAKEKKPDYSEFDETYHFERIKKRKR